MWFPTVISSFVLFGIAGFILKYGAFRSFPVSYLLLGLYISGGLCFLLFGVLTHQVEFGIQLLIAGLVVGTGSTAGNILFMKALRVGPVSLTSPVVNLNIVLVVIMSVFIYAESLAMSEVAGICLVILCVSILPVDPNEKLSIADRSWYTLTVVAIGLFFLRNGGLKITEELDMNNTMVLFYGYLLGIVWSWFLSRNAKKTTLLKLKGGRHRHALYFGLIAGFFSFGGMQLYAIALAEGPASIVSPIFASNSLVTGILAMIFLKERLSPLQVVAVIGILSGIILIRI